MAIVQISRITNRKGLQEDLPQLAGAEFGWAVNTRRLYIGNGTLEEGAPTIGNTEILTEYSDITSLSDYTYEDIIVGYPAQTGPTPSDPVVRTVQARLDDFASVRGFGAVGDGITDDTAAINRALYQLYCVQQTNVAARRTLYFPAGIYKISGSLIIPTYAKLVGEGADCTVIWLQETVGLTEYIAQFGDSKQQTGVNIGSNGATTPQNIEISSMTFRSSLGTDGFLVAQALECYFDSVNFVGSLTRSTFESSLPYPATTAVKFSSTISNVCKQITFDKCAFIGFKYGFSTVDTGMNSSARSISVTNGRFDTLHQGVRFAPENELDPLQPSPQGFRVQNNVFDNIYAEGIFCDAGTENIVSAQNIFLDVGNYYEISANTPCIVFKNSNNVSAYDMFDRDSSAAETFPRISMIGSTSNNVIALQLGTYARENGNLKTLLNNQTAQTAFSIAMRTIKAVTVNYTLTRGSAIRHGTLTITSSSSGVVYSEDYTETALSGITLSVTQIGDIATVKYTSTNTGIESTLTYSLSYLSQPIA